MSTVTIYLDPACPWAWLTSRWLLEVRSQRDITILPRLFSLAEVNRDHEANPTQARSHSAGEWAMRVMIQARRDGGDTALWELYSTVGEAYHERSEPLEDGSTLRAAARAAGLDEAIVERAWSDESTAAELDRDHRDAVEAGIFGVPALSVDGSPPTFGPIVDARLDAAAAADLYDRVSWLLTNHHFFELKRPRTGRPDVGRYRSRAAAGFPAGGGRNRRST